MSFVDKNRESYGVEPVCRMLPIATSLYYEHKARDKDPSRQPARAKRDVQLCGEIRRVRQENFDVYGVRKVWRQLRREGRDVARCTVARLICVKWASRARSVDVDSRRRSWIRAALARWTSWSATSTPHARTSSGSRT